MANSKKESKNGFGLVGSKVHYNYRSAVGHGTISGIAKQGKSRDTTEFKVKQADHHKGEPAVVKHWGKLLKKDN